jgi:hypothetical protein
MRNRKRIMLPQHHLKTTGFYSKKTTGFCNIVRKLLCENNLNESILRTLGARGMSMNREFVKNAILRRASRFVGTSIADSFTVNRRCKRLICRQWNLCTLLHRTCTLTHILGNKRLRDNNNLQTWPVLPTAVRSEEGRQLQALYQNLQKAAFFPCSHDRTQPALWKW